MNKSNKLAVFAAVVLGLAALSPVVARAQVSPAPTAETTTSTATTTDDRGDRDQHHNYGWIGLLGLLGLTGLMRKNRSDVARYDTTTSGRADVGGGDVRR